MTNQGGPLVLSLVIGTLNERDSLPGLIQRITALPLPAFEVIVIDDGSTDGTREYITTLQRADARVRGIFHNGARTLTLAQEEGILQAHGRFISVMDADSQHPPESIPRLLRILEDGADLAIASRYVPGGTAGERPLTRAIISRSAETLTKAYLPEARAVRDPLSGFFCFRASRFLPLPKLPRGYKLLLFLLAQSQGALIVEIPYAFARRNEGTSKITADLRFVPIFLSELLEARRCRRAWPHGKPGDRSEDRTDINPDRE